MQERQTARSTGEWRRLARMLLGALYAGTVRQSQCRAGLGQTEGGWAWEQSSMGVILSPQRAPHAVAEHVLAAVVLLHTRQQRLHA